MRWRAKVEVDPKEWHRWFAWKRVEIDGEIVWWEWVERRWIRSDLYPSHVHEVYEYRNLPRMLRK